MKTLTPKQIVDLKPCRGYNLEQVTELFDNKKSLTYLEILDTDKVPLGNIIWVFCQPGILDKDVSDQWTEIIVTRIVTNYALHCGVDKMEQWAKNWLSGVDRTTIAAYNIIHTARDAADANTAYGAAAAAGNTAYNATYAAAYAACAATDYTARAAVNATAYAARKTEHKQQIQDLKDILQGK
jgi:hypothetical protein